MSNRKEMRSNIDYAILETVRLASTHFDDPEERGHYEDQLAETIKHISVDLKKEDLTAANQLHFVLKKVNFTYESEILEKGISFAGRDINNPMDNIDAAFDVLEKKHDDHVGDLFLAKKITDAKIKNSSVSNSSKP
jgi:hypothetical protein